MPKVYCQVLNRNVDGGCHAFVYRLDQRRILSNPVRGIHTKCDFCKEETEKKADSKKITSTVKNPESEDRKNTLRIPQPVILRMIKVSEGEK
ncbi:MAG: hypothetical protein QXV37_00745 [Candidatus Jordarchaeaceae archaeon]